ncbi:prolipoprotein diacylglyceryl transferase [Aliiroseovarius crassostreae]|uniref:prolipoprotein diacylglyceryl transferase n=1 Tax=Aliiroseovarius crassostreae TaxID=154981 RepID=UPI0021AF8EC3|nr:prolipoprotein diacylglyceryl transferase [Aliiroseovarius crassostreae]UWQ02411.1 prolipoprotein diacylglyceryl transferase [Aliiroseovarius crassostreae]
MIMAIPFPALTPEIFTIELGPISFALRWYAMGYLVGIAIGWWIIAQALKRPALWRAGPPMERAQLEDLATWIVLGIIGGGRLGFVLFYQPDYYLSNPVEILKVWQGGMSFHGGFLGVIAAVFFWSRRRGLPVASVADCLAIAAPIGIGLVRIANFINAELWGRPTDLPWGVIFPGEAAQTCANLANGACARHPSQLYEAALEGTVLAAVLLHLAFRSGWLKRPGALTGGFFLGYGLARFTVEFFRLADAQFISADNPFGHVIRLGDYGITMGQTLTLPMIVIGAATLIWAFRRPLEDPARDQTT